jgi:hypothetical protein
MVEIEGIMEAIKIFEYLVPEHVVDDSDDIFLKGIL